MLLEDILRTAAIGWLQANIIEAILIDPHSNGFQFSDEAPTSPISGQLYLYVLYASDV